MKPPKPWKEMPLAAQAMTVVLYLAAAGVALAILGGLAKVVVRSWSWIWT